ncbi:frataxin homolog, mitochondrial [Wyeomyia smithii]|uniref:frataxin homolog, mitochondrial n=1 Tax=Wyeomyia smithii TaxID=174621 RepID=UPI002467D3D6|nr:frataxin homolog, mitochondrial [Wyeomyia smithii]
MSLLIAIRSLSTQVNNPRTIRLTPSLFNKHIKRTLSSHQLCCKQISKVQTNQSGADLLHNRRRNLRSMNPNNFISASLVDSATFEVVCSETLESLCDYMEQLVEETSFLKSADVTYGDGVLTVNFGKPYGTYVINRQSPNRQIWLSSPTSGPKRYDYIPDKSTTSKGCWVYKHDGISLHELLQRELPEIVQREVDFLSLPYGQRIK